jgi:hypothetical protein
VSIVIQLRRDLAANWVTVNPPLAQGELGVEYDTGKAKLGDGVSRWEDLPYWAPAGQDQGADKNFTQAFTVTDTVDVAHGLNKYPAVSVIDTAGTEVEGDVDYTSLNNLTVTFSAPFSGTVTCN